MVEAAASSPILDDSILEFPLDVLASVLDETQIALDAQSATEMFAAVAPLLETCAPTKPVLDFFTKYSGRLDVGHLVIKAFAPIVYAILKHNLDIGRRARRRIFVQEYIEVLRHQKKNGRQAVFAFIKRLHGSGSRCPHLRILPNLVSVCLPVIHGHYEAKQQHRTIPSYMKDDRLANEDSREEKLITYLTVMRIMCEYSDWLPHMARLLQPVPFPLEALADDLFLANFSTALLSIGDHERCEVHSTVLGARDGRRGWFDHFCPGSGLACSDGGQMYCTMLKRLLGCCGRRRQFIEARLYMLNTWCALAESSDRSAVDILIAALEYKLIVDDNEYSNRRIEKAILSTEFGERAFHEFCQRQKHLREIQQKIGPKQLTLQSKATDSDLSKILNSGSFGNLECLTLAFTDVTSACAQDIIMLPFLQQLNLWSTQFGDAGVELLSEHMRQLQVLNLCETPVTDRGLRCLSALKSLRKLNLNSTKVSALTFEKLKENLPLLQEYDVCYTDAW